MDLSKLEVAKKEKLTPVKLANGLPQPGSRPPSPEKQTELVTFS